MALDLLNQSRLLCQASHGSFSVVSFPSKEDAHWNKFCIKSISDCSDCSELWKGYYLYKIQKQLSGIPTNGCEWFCQHMSIKISPATVSIILYVMQIKNGYLVAKRYAIRNSLLAVTLVLKHYIVDLFCCTASGNWNFLSSQVLSSRVL